ncbi:MAG: adenosylhomocysteinase [Solirubrobacteraceae bacterium]|jgi:adenosylhomocysteinase
MPAGRRGTRALHEESVVEAGADRIAWADRQMPVLRAVRERFERERPLRDVRVGACLHVTAETANFVRALHAAGAEIALCAANPLSTQDDVAAALSARFGAEVHAIRGEDRASYVHNLELIVAGAPRVLIDDGAELIVTAHRSGTAQALIGATEETTTGLVRLRAMQAEGTLRCAVLAANEMLTERLFNDRYGTGQSALDGILRATNLLFAGRSVVVIGYGAAGRGIAARAKGAGAAVTVCEVDPVRALEARMEGYAVMGARAAAAIGEVFITVTGAPDVLGREHFELMSDGAVLANAGHFDVEISLEQLAALAVGPPRAVLPLVDEYELRDGRHLHLVAKGRVVNLAAASGHPAAVMDMSFAAQALAVAHLVKEGPELGPGVHDVPHALDEEVARLKLASLGVEIDTLSSEQARYLHTFR